MNRAEMTELLTFLYAQWNYVVIDELLTAQWQVAFEGTSRDQLYKAMIRALTENSRGQPPTIGEVNLFVRQNAQNDIRSKIREREEQQLAIPQTTRYTPAEVEAQREKNKAYLRAAIVALGKKRDMINALEKGKKYAQRTTATNAK